MRSLHTIRHKNLAATTGGRKLQLYIPPSRFSSMLRCCIVGYKIFIRLCLQSNPSPVTHKFTTQTDTSVYMYTLHATPAISFGPFSSFTPLQISRPHYPLFLHHLSLFRLCVPPCTLASFLPFACLCSTLRPWFKMFRIINFPPFTLTAAPPLSIQINAMRSTRKAAAP